MDQGRALAPPGRLSAGVATSAVLVPAPATATRGSSPPTAANLAANRAAPVVSISAIRTVSERPAGRVCAMSRIRASRRFSRSRQGRFATWAWRPLETVDGCQNRRQRPGWLAVACGLMTVVQCSRQVVVGDRVVWIRHGDESTVKLRATDAMWSGHDGSEPCSGTLYRLLPPLTKEPR